MTIPLIATSTLRSPGEPAPKPYFVWLVARLGSLPTAIATALVLWGLGGCAVRSGLTGRPMVAGKAEVIRPVTPAFMILRRNADSRSWELACSAVRIHAELALTAAHCLVDGEENLKRHSGAKLPFSRNLFFGFANRISELPAPAQQMGHSIITSPKSSPEMPDQSQFRNPNFNRNTLMRSGAGDIALLHLSAPAPEAYPIASLTQRALSMELQSGKKTGTTLEFLGYGLTENNADNTGILRSGILITLTSDSPGTFWADDAPPDPQTDDIANTQTAPCPGDSGAGLFLKKDSKRTHDDMGIVSLVNTAHNCADALELITDVGFYCQWIVDTARERFPIHIE